MRVIFVNAYEVTRHYGGPEEGGWWYNAGSPLASIPVSIPDDVLVQIAEERKRLYQENILAVEGTDDDNDPEAFSLNDETDRFAVNTMYNRPEVQAQVEYLKATLGHVNRGSIYSVLGGELLEVQVEAHMAEAWPKQRPHYE